MKRFIKTTVISMFTVFTLIGLQIQAKEFSGVIVYNITYENSSLDAKTIAMMPKTMKLTIKGNMSKTEINMGMGNTVVIFNAEEKTGVTLMDIMGQKFSMRMSAEEVDKTLDNAPKTSIEYSDETLEIAGYTCKKAIVSIGNEKGEKGMDQIVYYTDELGSGILNTNNPMFKDINGVMLKYSTTQDNMNMEFSALSVDKKKINDKEFEVPVGYKEVSQDELKSMFGGGM